MNDEVRRSITNQIMREVKNLEDSLRQDFQSQINILQGTLGGLQQAINTLTDRLISLAIRENNLIDEVNKRLGKE